MPRPMIPYIRIPDLHLGPLPLHPFGILVATGVLLGTSVSARRAKRRGYDLAKLNSFITWMLVSAFSLSHMLDAVFYHWQDEVRRLPWSFSPLADAMPWFLFKPWLGLSSFGGFIGALVGIVLWKYLEVIDGKVRVRTRSAPILAFADIVLSVLPLGWLFGRAGCSVVHDHPGARTAADAFLAVAYPLRPDDGTVTKLWFVELVVGHDPRFDLGLLELLFAAVLLLCFALTWGRKVPIGTYIVVTALAYSPMRFAMDSLRVSDTEGGDSRYGFLTPAQWCCLALFIFGLIMIAQLRRLKAKGVDLELCAMA